ncbi:unnamed protein product [Cochlearia groenlandica]
MGFSHTGISLYNQNNLCETELGFLRVPSLGFLDRTAQDLETKSHPEEVNVKKEVEEEDFCKTPTRPDQTLSLVPSICPPAPRKPKRVPLRSLKIRSSYRSKRMIILNASREIDFMLHANSLGNKIKKAKLFDFSYINV